MIEPTDFQSNSPAGRLLASLQRHVPHHDTVELRQVVRMARINIADITDLVDFLDGHADALTRVQSAVPAGYLPLAHVLSVTTSVSVAKPTCAACGRATFFLSHVADDGRWCSRCVSRNRTCASCGTAGAVRYMIFEGPVCSPCHRRLRNPPRPKATNGARREPCSICGKVSPVGGRWPRGVVGRCCHLKVLRTRTPCGACGRVLPLVGLGADGSAICGPCAGCSLDFACRSCGRTGDNYSVTSCTRCALHARLTKLFTGPDGIVTEQWLAIKATLSTADDPISVITWIKQAPAARMLGQLVHDNALVTHALLDTLPPSQAVHHLRDMLIRCGTLAARDDEYLHRIDPWLRTHLTDAPPHHVSVLAPFVRWYLLPKARRTVKQRGVGESAATTIPGTVLATSRLLAWLDSIHLELSNLTQSHVDEWIDNGQGHYRYLYPFITWARKHKLINRDIRIPFPQYPQTLRQLDSDDRLAQLRACLNNQTMPIHLRIAGTLASLFGISITAIVRLRREDLTIAIGATYLRIADHQLALPPRLATLIHELAKQPPRPHRTHGANGCTSPFLFPGQNPYRPIAPNSLYRQLATHGIQVLPARNSARLALAAHLPAPILASLTGIDITTAVAWNNRAGHDWTAFVAARASTRQEDSRCARGD